ncbi:MAG: hypothetical protein ACXVBW_00130 [Bdellovibrionota bacterium]
MALTCLILWMIFYAKFPRAEAILEHLSHMGSREVARSYRACLMILLTAGGAGVVTAGTVIFKAQLHGSPLSPVTILALGAINLVASFLLMQFFGFRLATKQAPLLGASLARKWNALVASNRDEVQWTARTQLSSALGNVGFVIPTAFAMQAVLSRALGHPLLSSHHAHELLASLNPWSTGTLAYATLTGGLLWLCSLIGATVASRMGRSKRVASAVFNISLGTFLALVPYLGTRLGMPLDVRHFTLSGGAVALSVASLGFGDALANGMLPALLGVFGIGILNFGVSFALSFALTRITRSFDDGLGSLARPLEGAR